MLGAQEPVLPDEPLAASSRPPGAPVSAVLNVSSSLDGLATRVRPVPAPPVALQDCPYDTTGSRTCRMHWRPLLISSAAFNAFQNGGNLYTGYWYRWETMHGNLITRWFDSVEKWRWSRWSDDNPFMDDYVAHPMMGSITNYMWIQNDPKGMPLEFSNTRPYWKSRMRALAFSTAYSFEWKMGPFGEATFGHNGDHLFQDNGGKWTNETGWVELVTTPVGGLAWTVGEDVLDKYVVRRMEAKPHNPFTLLAISFLTPSRSTANIVRFRPPWYRDGRVVKAASFWSEPVNPDAVSPEVAPGRAPGDMVASAAFERRAAGELPEWPHPGGVHEFGAWWGLSMFSGHLWGNESSARYMPIDVNYSYLLHSGQKWQFRYAPEVTALAMLDEQVRPNVLGKYDETQRRRTYGSGASPIGWRANFFTDKGVQPYLSSAGGLIYFTDPVLLPQSSRLLYTIDFGGGLQFFRWNRQAISIGYRYQQLSNVSFSNHYPGTDANTIYVAVSRFRTKGYR